MPSQTVLLKTTVTIIQFSAMLSPTGMLKVWEWLAGSGLYDIKSAIDGCHTVLPEWSTGGEREIQRSSFFSILPLSSSLHSQPWETENDCFSILKFTFLEWSFSPWNIASANTVHWSHDLCGNTGPWLTVTCGGVKEWRRGRDWAESLLLQPQAKGG